MEAILVATLFQAAGSIMDGYMQADMYKQQAAILNKQAEVDLVENQRRVAVEKSAAANESLERTKRLQRIIGSTISAGAAQGINANYGVMTSLNEDNQYEASIEEALARANTSQRVTSLNLNSAMNQYNLKTQASMAKSQASNSIIKGWMGAGQSMFGYADWKSTLGSAPAAAGRTQTYSDGTTITWNK